MQDFLNNPYRILGLFGGAGEREIRRNKSKIEAHSRVGKTAVFDNDISLKPPNRDEKTVAEALSKIESYENRVYYSLFWFVNAKHYDEAAINYLVSGEFKKAEEIWGKVINNQKVNQQNYTGFNNYGSLKFLLSINAFEDRLNLIEDGIINKLILIESPIACKFAQSVTEDNYDLNTEIILKRFLKSVDNDPALQDINSVGLLSKNGVSVSETTKKILIKESLDEIEGLVDDTVKLTKNNPSNANNAARSLEKISDNNLPIIKNVLGEDDLKYDSVRNNVAKELLQCAIAYFNHYADGNDISIGKEAEDIAIKANKLATNDNIIDKASKNLEIFRSWRKTFYVNTELGKLNKILNTLYNQQSYDIDYLLECYTECKNILFTVKNKLGNNSKIYMSYSSYSVQSIQNALIKKVNSEIEIWNKRNDFSSYMEMGPNERIIAGTYISSLHRIEVENILINAYKLQQKLGSFDMYSETRENYLRNIKDLENLKKQFIVENGYNYSKSSGGCYLATMVYGSYEHPKVMKFRNFRDNILEKSLLGNLFIKIYYSISPYLVMLLKNNNLCNMIIKRLLDFLIDKFGKSW